MPAKMQFPIPALRKQGRAALALLAVLVLLVVGAAWLSWGTGQSREGAVPAASPRAVPSRPDLKAPAGNRRTVPDPVPESSPSPGAGVEERMLEAVPAASKAPDRVVLTGAAIRVDASGAEHAGDDGTLSIVVHSAGAPEIEDIAILGGRFTLSVPPRASLVVRELVLAEHLIRIEPPERAIPEDRFLVLRGAGLASVLLHVVSAQDGRALEGVEVYAAEGPMFSRSRRHPGALPEAEPLVRGAASPVTLAPRGGSLWTSRAYYVRARGHAWDAVSLDHESGGERTLALQASAALDVELIGNEEWARPLVRLWPQDVGDRRTYPFAEREPDADGRAVFEALAPGTYTVSAERGWAEDRQSFGEATVEVVAGERATTLLSLDLPAAPQPARVSGVLVIEGGWDQDGLGLEFDAEGAASVWADRVLSLGLGDMQRIDSAGAARFAWSLELPVAGNYELAVTPLTVRRLLEVPVEGLTGVEVTVPAAADVHVTLHDSQTLEAVEAGRIYWSPPRVEGITGTPLLPVAFDAKRDGFTFRAPAGRIGISPADLSLEFLRGESFDVEPGQNSIEIGVKRRIGVKFAMRDGETTLPWSWEWRLRAQSVGGEARDRARSIGMLWFEEPGTYELYADKGIPGYASIDGTLFEVRALTAGEESLEVVVELEPQQER